MNTIWIMPKVTCPLQRGRMEPGSIARRVVFLLIYIPHADDGMHAADYIAILVLVACVFAAGALALHKRQLLSLRQARHLFKL